MKAVIQRVSQAKVSLRDDQGKFCQIGKGILVLLGIEKQDSDKEIDYILDKIINLRIFEDENGKMNLSLLDIDGDLMLISQFTLLADTKKGRRPSFINAGDPDQSCKIFNQFVEKAKSKVKNVQQGWFGEYMDVKLVNEGPVTIILESK